MTREVRHDGTGAFEVRFPFDRELVELLKTLPNRRWNATLRHWWVPEQDVVSLVDLLHRERFSFCAATRERYRAAGGTMAIDGESPRPGLFEGEHPDPMPETPAADPDYTVSRLNLEVRETLERAFPQSVWLVGEISGFHRNAHKRYAVNFQLVEREANGKATSSIEATLFDSTRRWIEQALASEGSPFRFEDEVTVRVRARVELYVPWGSYRVRIEDLDVRYTMGEAARRREEILSRLSEQGLLGRNAALPLAPLPLRVGLITSLHSDAYNDVLRTLEESGFAFRVLAHGARVQGHATEPSMLNALDALRARSEELDVVLICRGGGSRTDLAWLDSEALGRAVARFPLPVIVGIGHEQDHSVLDAVGRRAKTPTAAATLLVDAVRHSLESLERTGREILDRASGLLLAENRHGRDLARRVAVASRGLLQAERARAVEHRARTLRSARTVLAAADVRLGQRSRELPRAARVLLARERASLDAVRRGLAQGARRDVAAASRIVDEGEAALAQGAARLLSRESERTEGRSRRLHLVDPRRVIERGYAILRAQDGRVVTKAEAAPAGTQLRAELGDGALRLRSEGAEAGGPA